MASVDNNVTMSSSDNDLSGIIGEYSIPNLSEITSESLLTKSQYAKVIFHDLLPSYPTDADICCRYTLTDDITSRHGDRIALFRVGWVSVHDHVQFEVAPMKLDVEGKEFRVLFKASVLPKDTTEFYQLCYVNTDDAVCGASVPFQFRYPVEEELCEVEEQGGLVVVRSTTAISEEKLRDAARIIHELESEKSANKEKIQALENTKDSLSLKVEELSSLQKREAQLQQNLQVLEKDKTQTFKDLKQAEKKIHALCTKVDSLNKDNLVLNELLKSESHLVMTEEISRYKVQIDNMQQMLDALVDSKELASQALQCEQSKVMLLNIEHDKYKFRSQQLEEENKGLRMDLEQKRSMIDTLEIRLKQNEGLLETKFKENELTLTKLQQVIKQIGQLQFELNQAKETTDCLKLQLKHRGNQILLLDMEMNDFEEKVSSFDQLDEVYTNLKKKLRDYHGVCTKIKSLKEENDSLQDNVRHLEEEVSLLKQYKEERDKLSSAYELLSLSYVTLKGELFMNKNNTTQHEQLPLQNRVAQQSGNSQGASSIEQLRSMLSAAEATNASLMNELKQIKDLQPGWNADNHKNGNVMPTVTTRNAGECVKCTTTFRAPTRSSELSNLYLTLKGDREKLEAELQDVINKEREFVILYDSKSERMAENLEELVNAKNELKLTLIKNKQARDDLKILNARMVAIQQQLLHDDQREGRDFQGDEEQERLQRMLKRCHDLQCLISGSAAELHDMHQNIEVLNQERAHIEDELREKPYLDKKWAEDKCKILAKLVSLDENIIMLREGEMFPAEGLKISQDLSAELLENPQSCEISSTNLESSEEALIPPEEALFPPEVAVIPPQEAAIPPEEALFPPEDALFPPEDALIPPEEAPIPPEEAPIPAGETLIPPVVEGESKSDVGAESDWSLLEVYRAGKTDFSDTSTVASIESIEKAVETGVSEGVLHGIDTLKREVCEQLSPTSTISSTESITTIELKCALVNKECQEQEQRLQKDLAAALKNSVRKELMTAEEGTCSNFELDKTNVEANLKLRLDLAAEEYKKLYMQKLRLEKQLIKLQQKKLPPGLQLPEVNAHGEECPGFVCPFCGLYFQRTNREAFTRHYEDHLF